MLRSDGRLLVLMPNLRYVGGRYWDYFDHHLPLTHASLVEGLEMSGFSADRVIPRFLPYTVTLLVDSDATREKLTRFFPAAGVMRQVDDQPTAYVCENYACQLPTTEVSKFAELLQ